MRRIHAVLITTIVGAAALAACGSGDGGSPGGTAPGPGHFSVEGALKDLPPIKPSADRPLQAFATDFTLVARLGKLPKPDDEQSSAAWLRGLGDPKLYITGGEGLGLPRLQTGAMRKVLGFDVRDITTTSSVESLPDAVTVMHVADGVSPKDVTTTGDGKIGDLDPGAADGAPFPQIFGVARRDDRVAVAKTQKALDAWTSLGDTSLADFEPFREVAQALDEHRVYDVELTDRPLGDPLVSPAMVEAFPEPVPHYDAVGIAQALEDGRPVEYIAYYFADAEAALERVKGVWNEGNTIISGLPMGDLIELEDVSAKGHVVTAKVRDKEQAGVATQMLAHTDLPFFTLD